MHSIYHIVMSNTVANLKNFIINNFEKFKIEYSENDKKKVTFYDFSFWWKNSLYKVFIRDPHPKLYESESQVDIDNFIDALNNEIEYIAVAIEKNENIYVVFNEQDVEMMFDDLGLRIES